MTFKICVLVQDLEAKVGFQKVVNGHDGLKSEFNVQTIKYTSFEDFQEGKRIDKYDFVIVPALEAEQDFEMCEEFYKHYSAAPIISWVGQSATASEEFIKKLNDKSVVTGGEGAQEILDAISGCKTRHAEMLDNDVKPAFAKFDKDSSGAIDKDELGQLSKELGFELNEEQLTLALKDLDMNNDGVVDLEEFTRWYFTGMKPYNGARRTMLKLGSKTAGLMKVASEEAKAVLLGNELTTKSLGLSIGMNRPKDAQT